MATMSLSRLNHQLSVAKKASARARAKAGELMETALDTGLTGGTAMALGVWSKSAPASFKDMFFGVPAPLAIGLGAHAAAIFGVGRGMDKHVRSIGNGAIAAHLFNVGQDIAAAQSLPGSPVSGEGVTTADLLGR